MMGFASEQALCRFQLFTHGRHAIYYELGCMRRLPEMPHALTYDDEEC